MKKVITIVLGLVLLFFGYMWYDAYREKQKSDREVEEVRKFLKRQEDIREADFKSIDRETKLRQAESKAKKSSNKK